MTAVNIEGDGQAAADQLNSPGQVNPQGNAQYMMDGLLGLSHTVEDCSHGNKQQLSAQKEGV